MCKFTICNVCGDLEIRYHKDHFDSEAYMAYKRGEISYQILITKYIKLL